MGFSFFGWGKDRREHLRIDASQLGERRKYERYEVGLEFRYYTLSNVSVGYFTKSKNLSEGGVCIYVNNMTRLNDRIKFKMKMREMKFAVNGYGQVMWLEDRTDRSAPARKAGIRFIKMEDAVTNRIRGFIAEQNTNGADEIAESLSPEFVPAEVTNN